MKWLTKKTLISLLLWLLFLLLLIFSFSNLVRFSNFYTGVSLRYETPITSDDADSIRKRITEEGTETTAWPTFWTQKNQTLTTDLTTATANCIFFDGNGELLWENNFISGSLPSTLDTKGCAISTELAWQLWASTDVIGQTVTINKAEYTITGVFEDSTQKAFISTGGEPFKDGWTTVTLEGLSSKDARAQAETFVQDFGLSEPTNIVNEYGVVNIAKLFVILPLAVAVIYALFKLFRIHKNAKRWKKDLFLFGALLAIALLLPWLLSLLPNWLIPNQWSDFAFWGNTGKQIYKHLSEWFALDPTPKDVLAKFLLLKQAVFLFCYALLLPILTRRTIKS